MERTKHSALLAAMLVVFAVFATGCFRPASTDDFQQPTVRSNEGAPGPTMTIPPLATDTLSGEATVPPIIGTATALAATYQAQSSAAPAGPTQPPGEPGGAAGEAEGDAGEPADGDALPPTPTQLPIGPMAEGCTYIIGRGETLFSLAQRWGTTVNEIAALNGISNPNAVAAGTELRIPGCEDGQSMGVTQPEAGTSGGGQTYIVKAGDTVFGIARQFGLQAQDIINANPALQANPDQLTVGQELVIP